MTNGKFKNKIKENILNSLRESGEMTTLAISKKILRSWGYTFNLLKELEDEKRVERKRIATVILWKIFDIRNKYILGVE